jgi:hypothetical protein
VTFELAPGTWPITSDLTIPSTVTLRLVRGAAFTVAVGITLTINGPVFADDTTWYSGAGTVSVASTVSQVTGASIKAGTALSSGSTLAVGTNATVGGTLGVTGATAVAAITASGAAVLQSTLAVTGQVTVANLSASGTLGGVLSYRGARVYKSTNQSLSNASATLVTWDSESHDTSTIHDNSTNNSRLTVPAGVTRVRVNAFVSFQANTTGERLVYLLKSNSVNYDGYVEVIQAAVQLAGYKTNVQLASPVLTVTAGDYFEVMAYQNSTGALNVAGGNEASWFALEVLE